MQSCTVADLFLESLALVRRYCSRLTRSSTRLHYYPRLVSTTSLPCSGPTIPALLRPTIDDNRRAKPGQSS